MQAAEAEKKKETKTMEKKLLKVGKWSVENALGFGYDGCHKIYVAESHEEIHSLKSSGFKIYPMNELEKTFAESCYLRFISWDDIEKPCIVPQCAKKVTFTYNTGKSVVEFHH